MEQTIHSPENVTDFPALGTLSLWFGVLLIGATAVTQSRVEAPTAVSPSPLAGLNVLLVALLLASLLYLALLAQRGVLQAAAPLLINLGTLIIVQFVPFDRVWEDARFAWRVREMQQVAALVEAGAIVPDATGTAVLPPPYQALSADGGRILVTQQDGVTTLFFFTTRSGPHTFSGYLYRSDNEPPDPGLFNGRWRFVSQKRPYWFYCVSY